MYHRKWVKIQKLGYHQKLHHETMKPEWYICDIRQENYQNTHTRPKLE